jgi:vancomycin permeability regulator SanA
MRLAFTAAALLILLTLVFGVTHLVVGASSSKVHPTLETLPSRAVVIVPGAGLTHDGRPHGYLTQRLECARSALAAGKAHHILVSGDNGHSTYDEPTAMHRWLVEHGVPASAITRDHAGFRTRDTMERAAQVFGVTSAIICTQGLHANRSVFLATDAGIDAVALTARGDAWFPFSAHLRERVATVAAAFDVLFDTSPRYLGPPIELGALDPHDAPPAP